MTRMAEQRADLDAARELVRAGVPVFLGRPDAARPTGYAEPPGWQRSVPDESVVDAWQPGWALCAVMGHELDLIDLDPRSGGELPTAVESYAEARTPSGGRHLFVAPLGVESRDGVWPGVDYKGGRPDGVGRGYAFIAPTERVSKADGMLRAYTWSVPPEAWVIRGIRTNGHPAVAVRQRVLDLRAGRREDGPPRRVPTSVAAREWGAACERLTDDLRRWAAQGWGGDAHAGLLEATKHLVLLAPEHAEAGYLSAFRQAGITPDDADLAKLESALEKYGARADEVVADEEMPAGEGFWTGASVVPPFDQTVSDANGARGVRRGALTRGREAFAFYDEEELADLEPPEPVVEGLLYRGTVARLFGPPNAGKTMVALDLAAHVAQGMPWQGRAVKPGPAVYVYAEGATSSGERLGWWRAEHGRRTGVRVWPEAVQLDSTDWPAFVAACVAAEPATIWLDTIRACTEGMRENDNDDAAIVAGKLRYLAEETGAAVVAVAHPGVVVTEGRARGASAMLGALDTELELTDLGSGALALVQRKQRHAARGSTTLLRLVAAHGGLVVRGAAERGADGEFFGDRLEVAASAHLAALRAHEAAGWSPPPQLGVRELIRVLREELNRQGDEKAMRRAAHLFKAEHGQPVAVEPLAEGA